MKTYKEKNQRLKKERMKKKVRLKKSTRGSKGEEQQGDLEASTEVRVFRLASTTAMDMLMKLEIDGLTVGKIHTDRGHEFSGSFRRWASAREIILRRNAGNDPWLSKPSRLKSDESCTIPKSKLIGGLGH